MKIVQQLGDQSVELAQESSHKKPGMLNYNNLNMETSIHVEQCEDGPAKVTSGTFTMWIELVNAKFEDLHIEPVQERFFAAKGLHL